MNVVVGLDPGLENTGYGVVGFRLRGVGPGRQLVCVEFDHGVIKTRPTVSLERRLLQIQLAIREVLWGHKVILVAIEEYFATRFQKQAASVFRAQAVALAACAMAEAKVVMVNPTHVKTCLTKKGDASKGEVQKAIKSLFAFEEVPMSEHEVDALAIAVTALRDLDQESRATLLAEVEAEA